MQVNFCNYGVGFRPHESKHGLSADKQESISNQEFEDIKHVTGDSMIFSSSNNS